jgi:hypothetical protein
MTGFGRHMSLMETAVDPEVSRGEYLDTDRKVMISIKRFFHQLRKTQ